MANPSRFQLQPDRRLAFLQGFLKHPREVGSIVPSSRFLERRIVRCAGAEEARVVVELGPGTGGTTRALLHAMRPDARLLAVEINRRFVNLLRRHGDSRLIPHLGSALDLAGTLARHDLAPADVVLSGIPFSTIRRDLGQAILRSVHGALAEGGVFVAYQLRDRVEILGRQIFGPPRVQTEILNVPPMRVYRWVKESPNSAGPRARRSG
jgi:phosphatidylethanolamine/phosphatidyl-N-methylethanolamine N-methyltransferase